MISCMRTAVLMVLALIFGVSASMAQPTETSRQNSRQAADKPIYFNAEAREVIQPGTLSADKVSANSIGNVLTMLFDGAKLSLQTEGDPLSATWVANIRIPTNAGAQKVTSYLQHVRGSVVKSEDSRVALVLSLGGKIFVKEYPYGEKASGDVLLTYISSIEPRPAESYVASISILVERRNSKSAVLVDVDSLDVEARDEGDEELDINWSVVPAKVLRDSFGKRISQQFYGIEIALGNHSDSDLLIESFLFNPPGSIAFPPSSLRLVSEQTSGDRRARLREVGFDGNLVVLKDTSRRTLIFVPHQFLKASVKRDEFNPMEVMKQLGKLRWIHRKIASDKILVD